MTYENNKNIIKHKKFRQMLLMDACEHNNDLLMKVKNKIEN